MGIMVGNPCANFHTNKYWTIYPCGIKLCIQVCLSSLNTEMLSSSIKWSQLWVLSNAFIIWAYMDFVKSDVNNDVGVTVLFWSDFSCFHIQMYCLLLPLLPPTNGSYESLSTIIGKHLQNYKIMLGTRIPNLNTQRSILALWRNELGILHRHPPKTVLHPLLALGWPMLSILVHYVFPPIPSHIRCYCTFEWSKI